MQWPTIAHVRSGKCQPSIHTFYQGWQSPGECKDTGHVGDESETISAERVCTREGSEETSEGEGGVECGMCVHKEGRGGKEGERGGDQSGR